ncbi:MAG: ComEC/Rec2 family competence protein [Porphyromonas sp.]|nr:ComEC/Rec2 family competence protein [Porphyromonas sp.]
MSSEPRIPRVPSELSSSRVPVSYETYSTIAPVRKVRYTNRPAFLLLLATLVGFILYISNLSVWGVAAVALLSILLFAFRQRGVAYLLIWSLLFAWYAEIRDQDRVHLPDGQTIENAEIRIYYPVASSLEGTLSYHTKVKIPEGSWLTVQLQVPPNVELPEVYHYGGVITGTLDLSALRTVSGDSFRRYLMSEGYEAQGSLHRVSRYHEERFFSPLSSMRRLRSYLINDFNKATSQVLTTSERGLIFAISLGDRSFLPREVQSSFRSSGVAHILAVSGYHLGIVYALLSMVLTWLLPKYEQRRWRYATLLIGLILYTLLSGASVATVRALTMGGLVLLYRFFDRSPDVVQVLSLTVLLFLFIEPYALFSAGLALSVSAVWGIHLFLPLFDHYLPLEQPILRYLGRIIYVSLSAQIGVLPFLLYYFGTASLVVLWSNIPMILLSSILIPLAFILVLVVGVVGKLPLFLTLTLKWLSCGMIAIADRMGGESLAWLKLDLNFDLPLLILSYAILQSAYWLIVNYANRHHRALNVELF